MIVYAQNYPQLMNQARSAGFDRNQLVDLRAAFEVAQRMSVGLYRAEGCPLLNHLVRTASIALEHTRDSQLAMVGLLHAVYVLQDFDDSTSSSRLDARRQEVRRLFGADVEQMLWGYEALPWHQLKHIEMHIQTAAQKTAAEKRILHLRIINELEDNMDHAMEYTAAGRRTRRNNDYFRCCQQLARLLGHDRLADEMQLILDNPLSAEDFLCWDKPQGYELHERKWQRNLPEAGIALLRRIKRRLGIRLR